MPRRPPARGRAAALIVACAVIAAGAFAVTDVVSGAGPSAPAAAGAAHGAAAGVTGQAAVLAGALSDASGPAAGSASPPGQAARRVALHRLRRALIRLRRLGGMYGQFTIGTKEGPRTLAFERGTVTSVAGADVTVRAADGTTWTWVLTGASVVRQNGARTGHAALAAGERIFAGGAVSGAARDARLIVIRPAKQASPR